MKRKIRYLLGILLAVALFCAGIRRWTPVVFATENEEDPVVQGEGRPRVPAFLDEETAEWIRAAGEALAGLAAERDIMAAVYLCDEYPVRREPSYESEAAVTVLSGQTVNILDLYVDGETVWQYVRLGYREEEFYGYIPRGNLACSDARFLAWEEQYGLNFNVLTYTTDETGSVTYMDIEQFPDSYRPMLLEMKKKHPQWTFVRMDTGLDWEDAIRNELAGARSLVYYTLPDWAKEGLYDNGRWYFASEAALKRAMDPRNGLTEDAVFQFEQLTYNEQYHTLEAVSSFLSKSFMNDSVTAPGTSMQFSYIIYMIAKEKGREVSPFHLAARMVQEQGWAGGSPLVSGTYPGYEGYYNYFNIGATGTTSQQVYESGLRYAKEHWDQGAYFSILYGANFLTANYIRAGQDSLYLQKFNVNPSAKNPLYTHQYMQNISAPASEGQNIRKLYEQAGSLDSTFVFKIPVYRNMPEEPCGEPAVSTDVVLELPAGYSDATMWLDGVAVRGEVRNGRLVATASDGNAKTAVLYRYSDSGIPEGMYVWSLSYNGVVYCATPEPDLEDLLTYHGFSIRITGKAGIRFKTGISVATRRKLLTGEANGYQLKEYGTLAMYDVNRSKYPMIKGGAKVADSMSYGVDAGGQKHDTVLEMVDGRYRFTSVLVGLAVNQYKMDFAFRGYAVLERNGQQVTLYGPVRASNIYQLATRQIDKGNYQPGSEAYEFLQKLIADADELERLKQPEQSEESKQPEQQEEQKRPEQQEESKQPEQQEEQKRPEQQEESKQPEQSEESKQPEQQEEQKQPEQQEESKQPEQSEESKQPEQSEQPEGQE